VKRTTKRTGDSTAQVPVELDDLRTVAEAFAELGARLDHAGNDPFQAITTVARDQIPATAGASITRLREYMFE